jgi:hypothetical protein
LRIFENRTLRRIFEEKDEAVETGESLYGRTSKFVFFTKCC